MGTVAGTGMNKACMYARNPYKAQFFCMYSTGNRLLKKKKKEPRHFQYQQQEKKKKRKRKRKKKTLKPAA